MPCPCWEPCWPRGHLRLQHAARLSRCRWSPLYGCFGGIFGLLAAIGTLYGDTEFLLFFTIGIKARYMVAIYALIAIAMLFGEQRMYAFAQLGGALAGWLYVRMAPRRGISFLLSERWYGCATATTAGSAAAPPANSRST
jgi:membrane associated rhomboid family serine protease